MSLSREERDQRNAARALVRRLTQRERKAAIAKRPPNPKADRGRVRDPGFLAFLRRQPCVIGIAIATSSQCGGGIEACHIRSHKPGEPPTGLQRKPSDRRCTSMCHHHHMQQHAGNEMRFWASYSLDPFAVAEQLYAEYSTNSSAIQTPHVLRDDQNNV